jgi:hypothetical protein
MVVFVVLTVPLWLLGFAALVQSGVTLSEIKAAMAHNRRRNAGKPGPLR